MVQLILELGAYVGYSGVEFSRVSSVFHLDFHTVVTHGTVLTSQHLLEFYPRDQHKYPSQWTSSDQPGERAGYVSLEKSEVYAKTAQGSFDLAGLGDVVKVSNAGG